MFSTEPHRNIGTPKIQREVKAVPDDLLIATLVDLGQPRWSAEQVRYHPFVRFCAARVYCDVLDAAEGDKEAQLRIDYYRQCNQDMRKNELIADDRSRIGGVII